MSVENFREQPGWRHVSPGDNTLYAAYRYLHKVSIFKGQIRHVPIAGHNLITQHTSGGRKGLRQNVTVRFILGVCLTGRVIII